MIEHLGTFVSSTLLEKLNWIDGTPLWPRIEAYRRQLFAQFLDTFEADGRPVYNLGLFGRAKKNAKSLDLVLAGLVKLLRDHVSGSQCYIIANDEDQAGDDLALAKKLVAANPLLSAELTVRSRYIERKDGNGFIEILPANDVDQHGKTFSFLGYDEVHGQRNWDALEALQPDPHRLDAQTWITSYATIYHKPGVPLFDLLRLARSGEDPRFLFSWYAADFCTDPAFATLAPEARANPSMASWPNTDYLEQQRRRLPAHKYRRLHLNLPGLPAGSAFQAEPIMDAVLRGGTPATAPVGTPRQAFVDMSGGSSDDAVLAVGWCDAAGAAHVERVLHQGAAPPFDPDAAVVRFVDELKARGIRRVTGDAYAGNTFRSAFEKRGIGYDVCNRTKHQLYEALEPVLNARRVQWPDDTRIETQCLGLVWRGGRIDHLQGEHDDWINAVAGVVWQLIGRREHQSTARFGFADLPGL